MSCEELETVKGLKRAHRTQVTFGLYPCAEKCIQPLTFGLEMVYFLEQTISAGDGLSRSRALAGSCRLFSAFSASEG